MNHEGFVDENWRPIVHSCVGVDAKRIKHAELYLTDAAKEARSSMKSSREENKEEYLILKGQLYGPGIAD